MGKFKNLLCPKCGRTTKHKRVDLVSKVDEGVQTGLNEILGETWRCVICNNACMPRSGLNTRKSLYSARAAQPS